MGLKVGGISVEGWWMGFGLLLFWLRLLVRCGIYEGVFGGSFWLCFLVIMSCLRRLLVDNLFFCSWLKFMKCLFLGGCWWIRFLVGLYIIFFMGMKGLWEVCGWNSDCVLNLLLVNLINFVELLVMMCEFEEVDLWYLFLGLILLEEFLLRNVDEFELISLCVLGLMLMLWSFFLI